MKGYRVIFSPMALGQMEKLGGYIADRAGQKTALGYIAKIHKQCKSVQTAPLRGRSRSDIYIRGCRLWDSRKTLQGYTVDSRDHNR